MQRKIQGRSIARIESGPERAQDIDAQDQRTDLGEDLDPVGRLS